MLPTSRVLWWGWGIMKNIDIKSLIIGALLTSTIFLGVAAVPSGTGTIHDGVIWDTWDENQVWEVYSYDDDDLPKLDKGEEPFAVTHRADGSTKHIWGRKRVK